MDTLIKGTADSMYEQFFVESAVSTRANTTNLMKQKATKRTAKPQLGDGEIQSIIKLQAQHIERCMAARLESYQRAYEGAGRIPTEQELSEIREDFESVGELQVKNSSVFIENFLRTRRVSVEYDPEQRLVEASTDGHERVLRSWKTWGAKQRVKETVPAAAKVPAQVSVKTVAAREPERAETLALKKQRPSRTVLSYYWSFFKRLGKECNHTWRGEAAAAALTATGSYLLIQRVNAVVWTSFKGASLSMVIAIGAIALWHVLRTPWLLHKEALSRDGISHVHWGHGLFGIAVLAGVLGGGGIYARKQLAKPIAPVLAVPYMEPSNSLRKRTTGLANELDVFLAERWSRRPPGHGEATLKYDQITYDLYMKHYKNRTVGILQELQGKGLDTGLLAVSGGAPSRFLMPDEIRQLRDLAYHLDERGNVVRF